MQATSTDLLDLITRHAPTACVRREMGGPLTTAASLPSCRDRQENVLILSTDDIIAYNVLVN